MKEFELSSAYDALQNTKPLVLNITNYVTVNDCANALLAIGASPVMSDEPQDVVDIARICGALTINIGTLNKISIEAMLIAGEQCAESGVPIILDPVGAGASKLRTETSALLLDRLPISVIRGNMSELRALAEGATTTRGVDVCPDDLVTESNLIESAKFARACAQSADAVVAVTGPIDIIADKTRAYAGRNGSLMQEQITGAGCMLSCICAAYACANQDRFLASLAAVTHMGYAGQIAEKRMGDGDGNGSYRSYLLDALFQIDGEMLEKAALLEIVGSSDD